MDDDHDLVANTDSDTLIRIAKFLKRGEAPGPDNIHNEVLRIGITTLLFHHLAWLFTPTIQKGYILTPWKLATFRLLLKPDRLPSFLTRCRPISLTSSIMKLFEWVVEERLHSCQENIGFINKYQSGFRKVKVGDYSLKIHKFAYHLFSVLISKRGLSSLQTRKTFDKILRGNYRFLIPVIRVTPHNRAYLLHRASHFYAT